MMFCVVDVQAQKDDDIDDDVEAALDDESKVSGLTVGSYLGFGYSNGWQIEFSPEVGYKLFDFLIPSAGFTYSYVEQFLSQNTNDKQFATLVGPRVNLKAKVFGQFYAIAEYQFLTYNWKYKDNFGNVTPIEKSSENAFFLGAGYSSSFGEGFGIYSDFIFDVLYDRINSPRPAPYTFRFGVFYTFK